MRIQREGAQLQIRGTWSAGPGDDQARFLADLRALRDSAAIGCDELAARAHYPSNVLKEAENGPSLPGLPILTAYVRACQGDVLDWEERWRRLNPDVAEDPGLPVRPAGESAAAMAGARAGVSVAPPDVYDPERIKAALRGDQTRTEQASRGVSDSGISVPHRDLNHIDHDRPAESGISVGSAAGWSVGSGWDRVDDPGVTSANGNHMADHGDRGPFEAAFPSASDPAEPAQDEDFSWLKKSPPEPRPAEPEPMWREQAESRFSWSESADTGLDSPTASPAEPALPEPAVGLAGQERTDFWSKPVASVPSDLQRPTAASRPDEPATGRASWPAPADTATEPARRSTAEGAGTAAMFSGVSETSGVSGASVSGASGSQSQGSVRSAAQTAVGGRDDRRKDRLLPARLLIVIVIAALIGSALVLLLK
jgi:hypothetical protein